MDSFPILVLPRETRDQILGEVLFPSEKQSEDIGEQNHLGLAPTAVRQTSRMIRMTTVSHALILPSSGLVNSYSTKENGSCTGRLPGT